MNFLEAYEANKKQKVICLENHDVFDIDKMRSETTWYVDHFEGEWQIVEEPKPKVTRWLWALKKSDGTWMQSSTFMNDEEARNQLLYEFKEKFKIMKTELEFDT